MQTPKERYETDAAYKQAVDLMTSLIHKAQFTPSEIREMAVMASIHYEMQYGFKHYIVPANVNKAFETLEEWRAKNPK